MEEIGKRILSLCKIKQKKGIKTKYIYETLKEIKNKDINRSLKELLKKEILLKYKQTIYYTKTCKYVKATIITQKKGFFLAETYDKKNIKIYEEDSKFALTGDVVLLYVKNKDSKKAKVEKILKENQNPIIGTVVFRSRSFFVKPNSTSKHMFLVEKEDVKKIEKDDIVVAKILSRKDKNCLPFCKIIVNYKKSNKAIDYANAIAISFGARLSFSKEILKEANKLEKLDFKKEIKTRTDLTDKTIFTIDSKNSKDLDDAISVERYNNYYVLGVHIADVSFYVDLKSKIGKEALKRGCSIYYGDEVLPMLPKILSNNLCSLNPNEKKLAFSIFLCIDFCGNIKSYRLEKTIIKSKIKGIYEEINELLTQKEKSKYYEKYKDIFSNLNDMVELHNVLKNKRINRGSPQIATKESIVEFSENNIVINVEEKKAGISENIIEEFMLVANEAVATLAKKEKLPFIYRIHEPPPQEKIVELKKLIEKLGIPSKKIKPGLPPKVLANILKKFENTSIFHILNINILRSMSKATYEAKASSHFALVLKAYSHFTSPIRRYPDLVVHNILSEYITKKTKSKILYKHYKNHCKKSAKIASAAEKKATSIERACLDCFKAEFMKTKIGLNFEGIVVSAIQKGVFVRLQNTVEGFVNLENSKLNFDENLGFFDSTGKINYKIGQKVNIKCIAVNIASGKIDFCFND